MKIRGIDHNRFTQLLREKYNILMNASFTNDAIRIVTHRDVDKTKIDFDKNANHVIEKAINHGTWEDFCKVIEWTFEEY